MATEPVDVLIVQMGRPPQRIVDELDDQGAWFRAALAPLGVSTTAVQPWRGDALPTSAAFRAAVVTGAWEMVTDRHDWSERTGRWLAGLVDQAVPVLGVCYGHQLMADVLGGRVGYHPGGRESGTKTIRLLPEAVTDPVSGWLPTRFAAQLSHQQSVLEPPAGAVVLASSEHDGHQIIRYGAQALSCQFHPEFGEAHMRACLRLQQPALIREGRDAEQLLAEVDPTPDAARLLTGFIIAALGARGPQEALLDSAARAG